MQKIEVQTGFMPMCRAGEPTEVAFGIRRLLAPNPSPFTGPGTNSYLVGQRGLAVIDPGPDDDAHLGALLDALLPGQTISHILVTHAHLDHSALAPRLSQLTGAPVYAFGDAHAGRSDIMRRLSGGAALGGGEGTDMDFMPDHTLADDAFVSGDGWQMRALWTPGHFGNHLCFDFDGIVFTGDLVMGWSSSLVSPPDGDLTDFMASCEKLANRKATLFLPGHGPEVTDPQGRLAWLIAHRKARETSLLEALAGNSATPSQLTALVYESTPAHLLPAATRNVLAHLIDLTGRNLVAPVGTLHSEATFRRV